MKKYDLLVKEYNSNLLCLEYNDAAWFKQRHFDFLGIKDPGDVTVIEGTNGDFNYCVDIKLWKKKSDLEFRIFSEDRTLIEKEKKIHFEEGGKMLFLLDELNKTDFSRLSVQEISDYLDKIYNIDLEICHSGFKFVVIDFFGGKLTKRVNDIIKKKVFEHRLSRKASDYFYVLTQITDNTLSKDESIDFLKLALKAKSLSRKELGEALENHRKKYCWITFGFSGPALSKSFFEEELNDLIKKSNIEKSLESMQNENKKALNEINTACEELKLNEGEKYFADLAREIIFLKGYRKEVMVLSYYLVNLLVKEVSKRTFVPANDLLFLSSKELKKFLFEGEKALPKGLSERKKYMAWIHNENTSDVLLGEEARAFCKSNIIKEDFEDNLTELNGDIASPGRAVGRVKIVNSAADLKKFEKGDILVSHQTQPELVSAMKIAGAILTDFGGLTCHAAIVSRELNKPCIIGLKSATKVLKDGDLVEVDATHGRVKVLEKAKVQKND